MKQHTTYVGSLLLFAMGLAVAGVAAGRLVVGQEGNKPLGAELVSAWAGLSAVPFLVGLALMLAGGIAARRANTKQVLGSTAVSDDPATLLTEIKRVLSTLDVRSPQAVHLLSDLLEEKIPSVVDQRDVLIARHGIGSYAEFAGDFASFERNAARAWSAITDGVVHEAEQSLLLADAALERATSSYDRLVRAA